MSRYREKLYDIATYIAREARPHANSRIRSMPTSMAPRLATASAFRSWLRTPAAVPSRDGCVP